MDWFKRIVGKPNRDSTLEEWIDFDWPRAPGEEYPEICVHCQERFVYGGGLCMVCKALPIPDEIIPAYALCGIGQIESYLGGH